MVQVCRRFALVLCALLVPACGGGGGGGGGAGGGPPGTPPPPPPPATSLPGTAYPRLTPVNTSSPTHTISVPSNMAVSATTLQATLNLMTDLTIVFNTGGVDRVVSIDDPNTLYVPQSVLVNAPHPYRRVVIDGGGRITLDGQDARRILKQGYWVDLTLQNLAFVNGRAFDTGGGVDASEWDGRLTVINCTFDDCRATTNAPDIGGGAIRAAGKRHTRISGCTFTNCAGASGGAVGSLGSQLTIIECAFNNNQAYHTGGAVYVDGYYLNAEVRRLVISGCSFFNNTATSHAGAAYLLGYENTNAELFIDATSFTGNTVTGPGLGFGGAVYAQDGDQSVTNCTFNGNTTTVTGGAMWLHTLETCLVQNCTLQGNISGQFGGGVTLDTGSFSLRNCTLQGNHAAWWGGGIWSSPGHPVAVWNTILSQNTGLDMGAPGHNTNISFGTGGGNLQWPLNKPNGQPDTLMTAGTPVLNPNLQTLTGNGGPTDTLRLPAGSPALNTGVNAEAPSFDQRGRERKTVPTGVVDKGAFERQPGDP